MAHIDYFFAVYSPYTYLAGKRLEEIAQNHKATITYKPVDLMTLFDRTGGTRLAVRHPSRIEYRAQELSRWAKHRKLAFNLDAPFRGSNPAPASYAIIAAQNAHAATGHGDIGGLVHRLTACVWAREEDIADEAVIQSALKDHGFDAALTMTGLFEGALSYEKNLEEAVERGAFGAPFYLIRETDERFWGQDRLEFLNDALAEIKD
jgi:2-hydroxychromene-2-carboxylate isomerase